MTTGLKRKHVLAASKAGVAPFSLVTSLTSTPGSNGGVSSAIDTTNATLIVISTFGYAGPPSTVSDSKGNTYTPLTTRSNTGSTGVHKFYYKINPVVGTGHTFTVNSGGTYTGLIIYAFKGPVAPVFQVETGTTGDSPLQTGSVTPTKAGALIVTGLAAGGGTPTINLGFIPIVVPLVGGVNQLGAAGHLIQITAASINPTWNLGAVTPIAIAIIVFLPS